MVTKIVDNIQVDLAGVYIKLEDDCISDKLPFCVGITLKTLRVFTCDAAGNETYVVDS